MSKLKISGDDAIAILNQLGYFDEETLFMSLRLSHDEFSWIQQALALYPRLTPEQAISSFCEQEVYDSQEVSI